MLQVFDQKREIRRDGQTLTWGVVSPTSAAGKANNNQLAGAYYLTGIINQLFQQERHRKGAVLGAEFKATPDLTFNVDAFHSKLDAVYVQNRFIVRPGNSVAGGVIPSNVTMNGNVLASGQFNNTGSAMGTQLETYVNPKAQSKTEYLNGNIKYRLTENLKVTGQVGKTKAEGEAYEYGNTIFLPNVATAYTYEGAGSPIKVSLPNGVSGSNFSGLPGNSGADNNYSLQHSLDKETYGNADAEYRFDDSIWHSVKFGVRGADHERYGTRPMKAGVPMNATGNGQVTLTSIPTYAGGVYPSNFGSGLGSGVNVPSTPLIMADPVVDWSNANLSADRAFNLHKLSEQLTLTFEGLNLSNPTLRNYNKASATIPFENTTAFYTSGRQYYMGLRYKY